MDRETRYYTIVYFHRTVESQYVDLAVDGLQETIAPKVGYIFVYFRIIIGLESISGDWGSRMHRDLLPKKNSKASNTSESDHAHTGGGGTSSSKDSSIHHLPKDSLDSAETLEATSSTDSEKPSDETWTSWLLSKKPLKTS